jgi:hypothetical protein
LTLASCTTWEPPPEAFLALEVDHVAGVIGAIVSENINTWPGIFAWVNWPTAIGRLALTRVAN